MDDSVTNWPLVFRRTLAVVLLLWSIVIGPEELGPPLPEEPAPEPEPAPARVKPARPKPKREKTFGQPGLDAGPRPKIDKELFLTLFRRQARAELMKCLAGWRAPPASVALAGTLLAKGKLVDVAPLDRRDQLPPCADKAMAAMTFVPVTSGLGAPSVVVQWRIDW